MVFRGSDRLDMSGFSKQALDQMRHLVSESMEARMQSREAFLRLQSTVKAIQQLQTGSWPSPDADDLPTIERSGDLERRAVGQ